MSRSTSHRAATRQGPQASEELVARGKHIGPLFDLLKGDAGQIASQVGQAQLQIVGRDRLPVVHLLKESGHGDRGIELSEIHQALHDCVEELLPMRSLQVHMKDHGKDSVGRQLMQNTSDELSGDRSAVAGNK